MATKKKNRVTIELRPLCMSALSQTAKSVGMTVKEYCESFFNMALLHPQGAWVKLSPDIRSEATVAAADSEPELPLTEG